MSSGYRMEYAQQVPDDNVDTLEQIFHTSDSLYKQYVDVFQDLLRKAELRLTEYQLNEFRNLETRITNHVTAWYDVIKRSNDNAITLRTHYQSVMVQMDSLKQNITERDRIIETTTKEFESDKEQYENQLKVLETALAQSVPRNETLAKHRPLLEERDPDADSDAEFEIRKLRDELKEQERELQRVRNDNNTMQRRLELSQIETSGADNTVQDLIHEMGKKEEEILKLRWLTQDLASERNNLEQKIQSGTKDGQFVSITPSRQMDYHVDLSKFMDDDEDELSDNPAVKGFLALDMADDNEISPEVI